MRTLLLALFVLIASLLAARSAPPAIDGAWVLSDQWTGFIGISLVIKSNEFKYWFYSDVRSTQEPKYPITGKVEFDGKTIHLYPKGSEHLYATNWHLIVVQGETCLLAESHWLQYRAGQQLEADRLLYKLDVFDEQKPVMNRPRKVPATAAKTP